MLTPNQPRLRLLSTLALVLLLMGEAVPPFVFAAEPAPTVTITIAPGKNHISLTWTANPANCGYEVYRDTTPHFTPGAATLQAALPAGTASYVDYLAAGATPFDYFYVVLGIACSAGGSRDSNRVGKVYFPLVASGAWTPAYRTYGLNFGPYIAAGEDPTKGGDQITDAELAERLSLIAPYTEWIRTFGCNNDLREAGKFAHTRGLKAAIGAWLGPEDVVGGPEANRSQIDCLKQLIQAGQVDMAIVGSEVLYRGKPSADRLIAYINEVKQFVTQQGLSIPITTADTYGALLANDAVLQAVDVVMANYYPYWEGYKLACAMHYLHEEHKQLEIAAGGKEVIVSETGWPSEGKTVGDAVPSADNASFYFRDFVSWARAEHVKYFYFEAYDEPWKAMQPGAQPQESHFGLWTADGVLKPGMIRVFNGETMPDNWTNPPPDVPFTYFPTLPYHTDTNVSDFVVASFTDPANQVSFNGALLPTDTMDAQGNFAFTTPLTEGNNTLLLSIQPPGQPVTTTEKHVYYDPAFSTAGTRLLYVHSVAAEPGIPALPGTIVIDLDHDTVLGLIKDQYVAGISPAGNEFYTLDRSAISTATHRQLRILPFSAAIPGNGFIVSPDGTRLYSQNESVDVAANTRLANLPISIVSGTSWGIFARGGSGTSADGRRIYCCTNLQVVDTATNTTEAIPISSDILSDIAVTPDDHQVLISEFSSMTGRLRIFDAATFESVAQLSDLGDYTGDITFSADGQMAVVGSAGNPYHGGGRVTVVDLRSDSILSQTSEPLGDNIATSGSNEFFVSVGKRELYPRYGIDVYSLQASGTLTRTKTYYLGINRFQQSSVSGGKYDQIRRIVYKP